jgi:hypothetical protein
MKRLCNFAPLPRRSGAKSYQARIYNLSTAWLEFNRSINELRQSSNLRIIPPWPCGSGADWLRRFARRAKIQENAFFKVDWELVLSESVKLIVDAYVSLKDRQAMEELREHRQMLRAKLQASNGIDASSSIRLIESDLSEIEAGLARLQ